MQAKKMRNKKGIVLKETISIVIGVIALIILAVLAFTLYGMFIKKSSLEQARENLNQISDKINALKEGNSDSFLVTSPKNWYIVLYSESEKPAACFGKSCLCFCPEVNSEICYKNGVCNGFDFGISLYSSIKIDKFFTLTFIKKDGIVNLDIKS
jgi:hypothetical protein